MSFIIRRTIAESAARVMVTLPRLQNLHIGTRRIYYNSHLANLAASAGGGSAAQPSSIILPSTEVMLRSNIGRGLSLERIKVDVIP
jgi:hypothetical protein